LLAHLALSCFSNLRSAKIMRFKLLHRLTVHRARYPIAKR
jgi:hypothetical protein